MERIRHSIELSFTNCYIEIQKLGKDFNVIFSSELNSHIGCTVIAFPRPSLKNPDMVSSTSSVINVLGHKDEYICRMIAESFSKKYNSIAVCSGGFHFDDITKKQIDELTEKIKETLEKI